MTRRGQRGSITVFLCVVLASVIAVMGVLIDGARMRVAEAQLRRAAQLAVDSVMTQYSRPLREDYGLMALSPNQDPGALFGDVFQKNLTPNAQVDPDAVDWFWRSVGLSGPVASYADPLKLTIERESGALGSQPITEPDVLYRQIIEFSKYRVPMHLLTSGLFDTLDGLSDVQRTLKDDAAATQKMIEAGAEMQKVFDAEKAAKQAFDELIAAQDDQQSAADEWNALVGGGEDVEVSLPRDYALSDVDAQSFKAYAEQRLHNAGALLASEPWIVGASIPAYNVAGYQGALDDLEAEVQKSNENINSWYVNYQEDVINGYYEPREDDNSESVCQRGVDENNRELAEAQRDIAERYPDALRLLTDERAGALRDANQVISPLVDKCEQALRELDDARARAKTEIDRIDRQGFGGCSADVLEGWKGGEGVKGDYNAYTDLLKDCEEHVRQARQRLSDAAPEDPDPDGAIESYLGALNGQRGYDPMAFQVAPVAKIETYETTFKESEDDGDEACENVKDLMKSAAEEIDDKDRYRADKLPDAGEPSGSEASAYAKDGKSKVDDIKKRKKQLKAEDAESQTGQMMGPLDELLDPLAGGLGSVLGSVYASDYLLSMFGNAAPEQKDQRYDKGRFEYQTIESLRGQKVPVKKGEQDQGRVGFFRNAEAEYILYGGALEKGNVTRAQVPLGAICYLANVFQVQRNREIKTVVNAASEALMMVTGVPSVVYRVLFYLAIAGVETAFDMRYLMLGYKVPIFSMDGDMLFMMNPGDPNKILEAKGQLGISYEMYLRLQLIGKLNFAGPRATILKNTARLMEANIVESGKPFRAAQAFGSIEAVGAARMPYWFMTAPMMGDARQGYGYKRLAPATVVQSY